MDTLLSYDMSNKKGRDHIYVHTSMINDSDSDKIPLQTSYSKGDAIIENCHLYKMAISKFELSTLDLPLCIPRILIDGVNTDVNKLCYSFTLRYGTTDKQVFCTFTPQNVNAKVPTSYNPLTKQDLSTDYYYLNSFNYMIDILNDALNTAYTELNTAIGDIGSFPPFLSYSDGYLILNADVNKYADGIDNQIKIFCNASAYVLLSGFLTEDSTDLTNGKNYRFKMINNGNVLSLDDYNAITMIQEFKSAQNWVPVKSIAITTSNVPVFGEIVSYPNVFQPKQDFNDNSNQSVDVITNFSVDLDSNPTGYMPSVTYSTTNAFRFVDLKQVSSISDINISVYWRDEYGKLTQVYAYPKTSSYIDVVFVSRDLARN